MDGWKTEQRDYFCEIYLFFPLFHLFTSYWTFIIPINFIYSTTGLTNRSTARLRL
jgi:hypothetical protein